MTVYFVWDKTPRSYNCNNRQKYKDKLKEAFSHIQCLYPFLPLSQALYSKIVYIHSSHSKIDVDNMSKPFIDAFNNIIYSDDAIINHRACSKIRLQDLSSYEVRLDLLPEPVAKKLDDLISNRKKDIVYFEVGLFSSDMVSIGGEK